MKFSGDSSLRVCLSIEIDFWYYKSWNNRWLLSFMQPDAPFCLKWQTPSPAVSSWISRHNSVTFFSCWKLMACDDQLKLIRAFVCIWTICLNCNGNCQDRELSVWQVYVIQCRSCFEEWMVFRCCIFLLTFRKSRLFNWFCSTMRSWHHSSNIIYQCSSSFISHNT